LFLDLAEAFPNRFFIDEQIIDENFVFSMMTVLNEQTNS